MYLLQVLICSLNQTASVVIVNSDYFGFDFTTLNLELLRFITIVLTISLTGSIVETCSLVLTFESVDEILWCDHSNQTSF